MFRVFLLCAVAAAGLAACVAPPPPPPPPPPRDPAADYDPEEARTRAEQHVAAALGATVLAEARAAPSSVLVTLSQHHPRMIQQPDGSWKSEGPMLNAAMRSASGWTGYFGRKAAPLAPELARELDRILADPRLWTEPVFPTPDCIDWSGSTTIIRSQGRVRTSTQVCGNVGLTGRLASILLSGSIPEP